MPARKPAYSYGSSSDEELSSTNRRVRSSSSTARGTRSLAGGGDQKSLGFMGNPDAGRPYEWHTSPIHHNDDNKSHKELNREISDLGEQRNEAFKKSSEAYENLGTDMLGTYKSIQDHIAVFKGELHAHSKGLKGIRGGENRREYIRSAISTHHISDSRAISEKVNARLEQIPPEFRPEQLEGALEPNQHPQVYLKWLFKAKSALLTEEYYKMKGILTGDKKTFAKNSEKGLKLSHRIRELVEIRNAKFPRKPHITGEEPVHHATNANEPAARARNPRRRRTKKN